MPPVDDAARFVGEPPRRRRLVTLTPLIDVVFILLIFFMLATSFTDERVLELEPARAGGAAATPPEAIAHVFVGADVVRLGGRPMKLDAIVAELAARAEREAQRVVVQPGAEAPLEALVTVLAALRAGGVAGIDVAAP
jgi:biopolymer transport protein ExbD